MKTGINTEAFTIIEVLFFLFITTGMFVISATMLNGQQAKSQFLQSVQNFQSRLNDIANDVSSGNFKSSTSFSCAGDAIAETPVTVTTSGASSQGTNSGCIVAGQMVQFVIGSSAFQVISLAGKQKTTAGGVVKNVQSIVEALPVIIPSASVAASTERISYGTVVGSVSFDIGTGTQAAKGMILASTFGSYGGATGNNLNSGDIQSDIYPLTGSILPDWTLPSTATDLRTNKNPKNGFKICLQDSAANPKVHSDVILGGNGRQLSTTIKMGSGACL